MATRSPSRCASSACGRPIRRDVGLCDGSRDRSRRVRRRGPPRARVARERDPPVSRVAQCDGASMPVSLDEFAPIVPDIRHPSGTQRCAVATDCRCSPGGVIPARLCGGVDRRGTGLALESAPLRGGRVARAPTRWGAVRGLALRQVALRSVVSQRRVRQRTPAKRTLTNAVFGPARLASGRCLTDPAGTVRDELQRGRWRMGSRSPGTSGGYREPAPDPTQRPASALDQSGFYQALRAHWLRRAWRWIRDAATRTGGAAGRP